MSNRIEIIHIDVPMMESFRISSGVVTSKESVLVRIERDGIVAFGEASPMTGGVYSEETPDSTFAFLKEMAIPETLRDGTFRASFVETVLGKGSKNPFAWAGIEGALWDLQVAEEGKSFFELLELEPRPIESGLAVGIYPSISDLLEACESYLRAGYKRLKIKIEPGWDLEPLNAVREAFGEIPLMVDANAAYSETEFEVFQEIDKLGLLMIEQPLAKENLRGHAMLQETISTPICVDESASDNETVGEAIRMGACRIVNLKIQRVGGLGAAKRMCDLCAGEGIPCWVGTMPELGVGALHALYLAAHPNCAYPTDVEESSRWFVEDIVDPPILVNEGLIEIPEAHRRRPGVNMNVVDRFTVKTESFEF